MRGYATQDLQVSSSYTSELPGDAETENRLRQVCLPACTLEVALAGIVAMILAPEFRVQPSLLQSNPLFPAGRYMVPSGRQSAQHQHAQIHTW